MTTVIITSISVKPLRFCKNEVFFIQPSPLLNVSYCYKCEFITSERAVVDCVRNFRIAAPQPLRARETGASTDSTPASQARGEDASD
ncbi:hypothetical protein [Variovorax sp. TBS-050B]|uniref:hypothetical protein n=1 Tax=Variovorax sp. TBS-050B TaxID=2940551 RepID=UPI0024755C24|nr:hypothetical protein [Variovorax sp. TBS-050B]